MGFDIMTFVNLGDDISNDDINELYSFVKELFPICRSITGNGVRETLKKIQRYIPIEIHEVPTGTKVFDWIVPKEWNIVDAYVKNSKGERVVDFKKSNLHILQYSIPIHKKISLKDLKNHLYTMEEYPDWIPYKTSYYQENWGFCLSHNDYIKLQDDEYEVFIDSTLEDGSLTYAELLLKGELTDEILFSTYVCHPSMCNDNLTGISILTFLAKLLKNKELKNSYRFLFIPETIGAITWLSMNENNVQKIKAGLVATCLGDSGSITYKKSPIENSIIDRAVQKVLQDSKSDFKLMDFFPLGSDERQFCSPGFDLPIGSLMRTIYGEFSEYHTSADDLEFINQQSLEDSFKKYVDVVNVLDNDETYIRLNPKCEPNLGKRGLYNLIGASKNSKQSNESILWVLNQSNGNNSLLDISIKSNLEFIKIKKAAKSLAENGLIELKS